MSLVFNRYKGFPIIKALIVKLKLLKLYNENAIRIVEINKEFYAVCIESPIREFIIGKEVAWYTDENGYLKESKLEEFKLPYKISKCINKYGCRKIYDEHVGLGHEILFYCIKNEGLESISEKNINNHILFLLNTFVDKYYSKEEFEKYDYAGKNTISRLHSDLIENKELNIVSINPFKNKVRIEKSGNIFEIRYRPICKNCSNCKSIDLIGYEASLEDINKFENIGEVKDIINKLEKKEINKLISEDGHRIKYVDFPTKTMMRIAIENYFSCITEINSLSIEVYEELIKEYNECLEYLDRMSEEIKVYMLEKDIGNIKYLKDISEYILSRFIDNIDYETLRDRNLKKLYIKYITENKIKEKLKNINYINDYNINILKSAYQNLYNGVLKNKNYETIFIKNKYPLHEHMKILYSILNCYKAQFSTAYISDEGISLVSDIIDNLIQNKEMQLIIGSIYNLYGKLCINTARYMNFLIEDGLKVKTYDEVFFNGNSYLFLGKEVSAVISGSSNLTFASIYENIEINTITVFHNNSSIYETIINYFKNLWDNSKLIEGIDIEDSNTTTNKGSINNNYEREFNYLLEEKPDKEYKNEVIFPGYIYENDYCGFYFERYSKMLVLESLKYQNAVYVFINVEDPDKFIRELTGKDLSTELSQYKKRFNHSSNESYKREIKELMRSSINN